jgi:predicted 2-oxoglutarate/Fe(II)-dependent dioxygenase YbiX
MDTISYFENNGYVVLSNALDSESCTELVNHMFELHKNNKTVKDEQCPLSDAVYGDKVFDNLLSELADPIGKHVGRKLLPTYTYARIYRPNEILKKHVDRPSCEISATITLGFDGKVVWPIYVDEEKEIKLNLDIGDLLVYKGCEVTHWRPKYKGTWQVQVFLHYVDADGPYTEYVLDKRSQLGIEKNTITQNNLKKPIIADNKRKSIVEDSYKLYEDEPIANNKKISIDIPTPIFDYVMLPSLPRELPSYFGCTPSNASEISFTKEECKSIIALISNTYGDSAKVGNANKHVAKIRAANNYAVHNNDSNRWIFHKLGLIVNFANHKHFNYDIWGINPYLQLLEYETNNNGENGHYISHVDVGPGPFAFRKISVVVQLSDPNTYTGCELVINNYTNPIRASNEQGSVHLFPSFMPHEVTPIKSGTRYSLVTWIEGPMFR